MEQTLAQDIEEIEVDIDIAKEHIALGDALVRLKKNPDFKKIFEEYYMVQEPARVVQAMADPNMQTESFQRGFHNIIRSVGNFGQFMTNILVTADRAEKLLEYAEEQRLEMLREEQ